MGYGEEGEAISRCKRKKKIVEQKEEKMVKENGSKKPLADDEKAIPTSKTGASKQGDIQKIILRGKPVKSAEEQIVRR